MARTQEPRIRYIDPNAPQTGAIVPIGKRLPWLDGRESVSNMGGLPPLRWLTWYATGPGYLGSSQEMSGYFPAYARELSAYPASGARFRFGEDFVDPMSDSAGRSRVLPWSEIVRHGLAESVTGPNVGLLLDPGISVEGAQVESYRTGKAVIIHPVAIYPLVPFIQEKRGEGILDPATRFPLVSQNHDAWQQPTLVSGLRSLYRSWKARISEIVLGVFNRPHYVYPDCDPAFSYGVARFDQTQSTPAEDKTKLWVAHRPSVVLVKGNDEVSRPEGILISGTPIKLQAARGVFDSLNVEVTPGSEGLLLSGLPIPHKISVPSDLLPKEVRAALRELDLI